MYPLSIHTTNHHAHFGQGARLTLAQVHMHENGGEGFDSSVE